MVDELDKVLLDNLKGAIKDSPMLVRFQFLFNPIGPKLKPQYVQAIYPFLKQHRRIKIIDWLKQDESLKQVIDAFELPSEIAQETCNTCDTLQKKLSQGKLQAHIHDDYLYPLLHFFQHNSQASQAEQQALLEKLASYHILGLPFNQAIANAQNYHEAASNINFLRQFVTTLAVGLKQHAADRLNLLINMQAVVSHFTQKVCSPNFDSDEAQKMLKEANSALVKACQQANFIFDEAYPQAITACEAINFSRPDAFMQKVTDEQAMAYIKFINFWQQQYLLPLLTPYFHQGGHARILATHLFLQGFNLQHSPYFETTFSACKKNDGFSLADTDLTNLGYIIDKYERLALAPINTPMTEALTKTCFVVGFDYFKDKQVTQKITPEHLDTTQRARYDAFKQAW